MTGETVALPTVAHCWNRIGVHGDRSCPELAEHIHCRNCPVYAAGGQRLYDRSPPADYLAEWTDRIAAPDPPPPGDTLPVVLFRVGPEWLALDVKHTVEVAPARTVRRVPHQTAGLLAGLVNIRGELQLAVSLRHLLGLDPEAEEPPTARHLVAEHDAPGGCCRWTRCSTSGTFPGGRPGAGAGHRLPGRRHVHPRRLPVGRPGGRAPRPGPAVRRPEAGVPMTDAPADPLMDLFRTEVAEATAALADGLAVLAADPKQTAQLDALDRAAKRAKAAALIVGQAATADAAQRLEAAVAAGRTGGVTAAKVGEWEGLVNELTATSEGSQNRSPSHLGGEGLGVRGEDSAPSQPPEMGRSADPSPPAPLPPRGEGAKLSVPPPDSSLLELFREEVRSLTGTLSGGLVELEAAPADPRRIEPLMRAAHSLKGAARIVAVEPAVEAAHAMEDLLVAAQAGNHAITPDDIDALLAGTDLLAELAAADLGAWAAASVDRVAAVKARLRGETVRPRPREGEPPAEPGSAPQRPEATPAAVAGQGTPSSRPADGSAGASPSPPSSADAERVVRVTAQSLTRLLSLAGESLVEARWLQPFARTLFTLKKHQDHLADVLDEVARTAGTDAARDARRRLTECRQGLADRIAAFEAHARRSDELNSRLYREVIASRMRPFADGTHGLSRMARDVARQLGKQVTVRLLGQDTDVDRDILDKLDAPLGHLVRNAIDHAIEPPDERAAAGKPAAGTLTVEARHHAGMLTVSVSDDGRGIDLDRLRKKVVERGLTTAELAARLSDPELLDFLFLPGFSTAAAVTDVSGRGVGLDVVQTTAQQVGGSVRVNTQLGNGTRFELHLPITLSVVRAVLVTVSGDPFALPLNRTDRLLKLPADRVRQLEGKPHFEADGRHVGLVPAHQVFDLPGPPPAGDELAVVMVADRSHRYGLIVDGFLGEQDLVVRPLDPRLGKVPNVAAASLLEDGSPVLIVDVDDVARSVAALVHEGRLRHRKPEKPGESRRKRVLVVDDSAIVREVERQLLAGRGYQVDVAVDGADGWNALRQVGYDLVVSDIDMPRMTGLELVRAIRADPAVRSLPVVVVSYKDRPDDRAKGLDAGANFYLTKGSFHDGQFLAAVAELIGPAEG
ncbi:MAG: chemotaxis protein CheW [Gemmataceae bacterium]